MPGIGGLSIANNLLANNIGLNLSINQSKLKNLADQLSSGLRINTSADDASGYAIATTLQNQVSGFDQATRNIQDSTNAVNVANGALTATTNILSRLRTLAVEASSDLVSTADRQNIQVEVQQLTQEVNRIAANTSFNNVNLLDGSHSGYQPVQLASIAVSSNSQLTSGSNLVSVSISTASNTTADGTYEIQVVSGSYATSTGPNVIVSYISSAGNVGTLVTQFVNAAVGASIGITLFSGGGTIYISNATFADIGSVSFVKEQQFITAVGALPTTSVLTFQDGDNQGQVIQFGISGTSAASLRIANLNVLAGNSTFSTLASEDAIAQIDNATTLILQSQASLGAIANRLQIDGDNNQIASVNLQASESAIRDLNVAQASSQYTSLQILVQAGSSLLSQANTNAQSVLGLFR